MQTIQLISLRHSAFYTPYLITFVAGFLKQQGLKAVYRSVASVAELEAALITGEAHVAQSAVGVSMRQIAMAEKNSVSESMPVLLHFAQINQRDGFFIAASPQAASEAKEFNWKQLEHKRIITDHLFQPMATLKYVLHKQAVDINSIEFIDAGNAEQSVQSFLAGEAEYLHLQGPYPQQLAADGKATIVASVGKSLGEIAYSSLCATKDWLATPMASAFMQAYTAALLYVEKTSAARLAQQLTEQFGNITLETLVETIESYKALGSWPSSACISEDAFQCANRVFLFSGDISSTIDYRQVVTRQLCSGE